MRIARWQHDDGRIVIVYPHTRLEYYPPGYEGEAERRPVTMNGRRRVLSDSHCLPAGYTVRAIHRPRGFRMADEDWYTLAVFGKGWTKVYDGGRVEK